MSRPRRLHFLRRRDLSVISASIREIVVRSSGSQYKPLLITSGRTDTRYGQLNLTTLGGIWRPLEAGNCLLLEVKGLAGDNISVQLTPNEYEQMIRHRSEYRVCVVTGAASAEPSLWVFADVNGEWRSLGRRKTKLQVTERTGAILSEVHLTDSAECAGCE